MPRRCSAVFPKAVLARATLTGEAASATSRVTAARAPCGRGRRGAGEALDHPRRRGEPSVGALRCSSARAGSASDARLGSSDPVFSANDTIAWYSALVAADAHAASYARLFLVPGMNHCSGGPATERFNLLPALQKWVEDGTAPTSVIAAVDPANPDVLAQGRSSVRTRPLCAYPKRAVFTRRNGNPDNASSFTCQ